MRKVIAMPIGDIGRYTNRSRRFVRLTDGRVVPRATAENMYARSQGYRGNYERRQSYREMKRARRYERDIQDARDNFRRRGQGFSKREYDEARARLQAEYARHGGSWRDIDKSPDGALAKYLEATGRRAPDTPYAVGESPTVI